MRIRQSIIFTFLLIICNQLLAFNNPSTKYLDTVNSFQGEERYTYLIDHLEIINDDFADTILHFAEESMLWANGNNNARVKGISNLLKGNHFVTERKFDSAFHYMVLADKYLELSKDYVNLARVYNEKGYMFLVLGLKSEGIDAIEKAMNLAYGKAFDVWYIGKSNLAGTLMHSEPVQALKILNELKDTLESKGSSRLGAVYNKMAILKRRGDSAVYFFNRAIKFNRSNGNQLDLQKGISGFGFYYQIIGENNKAISQFKQALKIAKDLNLKEELFNAYKGLSFSFLDKKQLDSANIYLDSMRIVFKNNQLSSIAKSNLLMAVIAQRYEEGKYKEACDRYTKWFYFNDSLEKNTASQLAMVLNLKMDDKEKDWKISLLKESSKVQKWKFWGLLILISCIAIIAILGFLSYNRKRKSERLIVQLELEKEREKKKRLEIENQQKKKELISKSLQLSKKNQFLEELRTEINQAVENESKGDYLKLKNLIKINHNVEKDWEEIRSYFDQLSPSFFHELENSSTDLSPADKKLAVLIHLRIDSQDAANILHIARSSIKTARYRLKKKLNLENEESLDLYLMNLAK